MTSRSTIARDDTDDLSTVGGGRAIDASRLGVYSAMGASVGALPLPWLPQRLLRRVRGALVHDFAVRHGLSLTREARDVLAEPCGRDDPRSVIAQLLGYVGARLALRTLARFGPIGLLWPLRDGVRTYVLGHLFDRYLEMARSERAVRIDGEEARRVRRAIDASLARAMTVDAAPIPEPVAIDDQRDFATAVVDSLLALAAGVPDRMVHRVDAAFDDLIKTADG